MSRAETTILSVGGTEIITEPGRKPAVKGELAQSKQNGPAKPGKHSSDQNGRAGEKIRAVKNPVLTEENA